MQKMRDLNDKPLSKKDYLVVSSLLFGLFLEQAT